MAQITSARDDAAAAVLRELDKRAVELKARPRPPAWQADALAHDDQLKRGPRYSTVGWFGVETEAGRMRILRAVYRLQAAGLVTVVKTGARLTNLLLTEAGKKAAAELARNSAAEPASVA